MAKNVSTLTKKEQKAINQEREKVHKAMLKRAKDERYLPKSLNPEAYISLSHINKIYPNHVQAVYDFNLDIKEKEFIVFVGPSGCGKSTTLRMIAGLEDITYGDLFIDGVYANELPSKARHVGVVFQSYALFPHMNVYDNLAFGLQINHVDKKEIDERVHKVAKTLELEEYLGRKPAELSGGQCQRVALGRAIIKDCKVFLMDEPLSNLDAKLRVQMRSEIVRLHNALNTTTIYVTHDQTEAMTMASRIVVMSKGYIQQIGTPSEIYNHPSNIFVATFIGSPAMNVLNAKEEKGKLIFGGNYSFPLEKNFSEVVDKFYDSEIASYKNRIEELKDVFLERFLNDKKYLAIANALDVEKEKANFAKMIKAFDEEILEGLAKEKEEIYQTGDKETRMDVLKAFLREYLYLYNVKNNPEIKELETTLGKLINIKDVENKDFLLGIRPEDILDIKEPTKKETSGKFDFNISLLELVGNEYFAHVDLGENKDLIFKISADNPLKMGDVVSVSFIKNKIHIFDTITKKTIY